MKNACFNFPPVNENLLLKNLFQSNKTPASKDVINRKVELENLFIRLNQRMFGFFACNANQLIDLLLQI